MVALSWLMQQQKQRQKRGSERSQPAFFLLIADAGWAVHQTIDCSRLSEWFQTYILIICFIIGHYFSDDTRTQAHTLLLLLKIMVVHRERVLGVQHCSGRQVKVRKQPKREKERIFFWWTNLLCVCVLHSSLLGALEIWTDECELGKTSSSIASQRGKCRQKLTWLRRALLLTILFSFLCQTHLLRYKISGHLRRRRRQQPFWTQMEQQFCFFFFSIFGRLSLSSTTSSSTNF